MMKLVQFETWVVCTRVYGITAGCLIVGYYFPGHVCCSCRVLGVESALDGFASGKLVGVCRLVGEGKKGKVGGKAGVIAGLFLTEVAVGRL